MPLFTQETGAPIFPYMAIRKIARMGHPVLRQVADPVLELRGPAIRALVEDMFETMDDAQGTGLAAPQIHESLRVVVFEVGESRLTGREDDTALGRQVLINPDIEAIGDEVETDWEGCLSVPGMVGAVPRPVRIRYRGLDGSGKAVDRTVSGFHARVVQHECDHLDGILYPMRMPDMSLFGYVEEMAKKVEADERDAVMEAAE